MTRVLVLGGSWFLGRSVVDDALARGWEVTTFRRGLTGEDAPGVHVVRGDRTNAVDIGRLASAGPWDAVIDTSGFRASGDAGGCWSEFGYDGDPGPSVYGFTKAGCERAIHEVFGPDRTAVLRPGVILGPREYVGRLPWWLQRVKRGGRVLAPGRSERAIQPIDVRDVAAFALHAATGPVGTFNVTASGDESMGDFLAACRRVTGSFNVEFEWIVDEGWLAAQGVAQWTECTPGESGT